MAAFPAMMERGRKREGLRVCRAAWLLSISVREYRELEAGKRLPAFETWDRICKLLRVAADVRRNRDHVVPTPD
jgi:hypothetical protein